MIVGYLCSRDKAPIAMCMAGRPAVVVIKRERQDASIGTTTQCEGGPQRPAWHSGRHPSNAEAINFAAALISETGSGTVDVENQLADASARIERVTWQREESSTCTA